MNPDDDTLRAAEDVIAESTDLEARLRRMGMKLNALVDRLDQLREARNVGP